MPRSLKSCSPRAAVVFAPSIVSATYRPSCCRRYEDDVIPIAKEREAIMTNDFSFEPLSPVSFLRRSGLVYADKIAIVDDGRQTTYAEFLTRAEKLAGALVGAGVAAGERVAVMAPNTQPMLEAHFGVPL